MKMPRTPSQWMDAMDLAHVALLIDSARKYGLIKGGPEVDVARCEQLLARGKELRPGGQQGMKSTRAINGNQTALYWREWGKARRELRKTMDPDAADAERHAIHIRALGAEKSSKDFTNEDLDKVLALFRAISKPAGFREQIEAADRPAKRGRFKVSELLAALGKTEEDLQAMIEDRLWGGGLVTVHGDAAATFETLGPADLERLALDLKKECRSRWPRKGDLLTEIRLMRMEGDYDEATARAAVAQALGVAVEALKEFHALGYDELLKVMAVLRRDFGQVTAATGSQGEGDPF